MILKMQTKIKNVLWYFPDKLQKAIAIEVSENIDKLEEIRIRALRPVILKLRDEERVIKYDVSQEEILNTLARVCENSIYSHQNEIACRICYCKRWSQSWNFRFMCYRKFKSNKY